jgi:hypothetical protein
VKIKKRVAGPQDPVNGVCAPETQLSSSSGAS